MATVLSEKEQKFEDFLNESEPWTTANVYQFNKGGAIGIFRRETIYVGGVWASTMISEPQMWSTQTLPKKLPVDAIGSFFYLVEMSAYGGKIDKVEIIEDFLDPWDDRYRPETKWTKRPHYNGSFLQTVHSVHYKNPTFSRYITFFCDDEGEPCSKILYQYVVSPEGGARMNRWSSYIANSMSTRKRKRERMEYKRAGDKEEPDSVSPGDPPSPRFTYQPCTSQTLINVADHERFERYNPRTPTPEAPPNTEDYTVQSVSRTLEDFQQSIDKMKSWYCALNGPDGMMNVNQKILKLYEVEKELRDTIQEAVEKAKKAKEDIVMEKEVGVKPEEEAVSSSVGNNQAPGISDDVVVKAEYERVVNNEQ